MTARDGVLLIINDHVDIALAVDADGVHLGQDGFASSKVVSRAGTGACSSEPGQALQAEKDGGDYINIGPILADARESAEG